MRKQEIKNMLIDRLVAVDLLDAFCLDHKVRLDDGSCNSVNLSDLHFFDCFLLNSLPNVVFV